MTLKTAYAFFWAIFLLQIIGMTIFQVVFYRKLTFSGVFRKILFALEHAHIFDTAKDWDEAEGNFLEYKHNWRKTKIEFCVGTALHWTINIILLTPIFFISKS